MGIDLKKYHSGESAGSKDFKRNPTLSPNLLPKKGSVNVKLLESPREISNDFGDSLVMDASMKGKTYALFLRADSVILGQVIQALGKNTDKWKGKTIRLVLAKGKFMNCEVK